MAKKKGVIASPFVPVEEQPYKIPDNWCWVRLGVLGYTNIGLTYKPSDKSENGIVVLRSGNIQDGKMDYTDVVKVDMKIPQDKMSKCGDILICARNGSKALVGKTAIIDRNGMSYGAFMAIFRSPFNNFVFHYLNSHYFRSIIDQDVGTSTINQVTQALIKQLPFPLAPVSEQQRIVLRIESLFAKLDEAKEKAQAVVDGFELRKSAILHKAFTGELTERWRKEHEGDTKSWNINQLGELTEITSSKRIYKEEYVESGIPFFRSSEVVELNDFGFTEPQFFISSKRYEEIKLQYGVPEQGDLLVTSVGTIGKTWVVDNRSFYYKDGNLTQVKQCSALDMKYLQFYIQSEGFKEQIRNSVAGSAYNALTIVKFKKIKIPIPSRKEQSAIIGMLDSIFTQEQQAKEAVEAVLDQIDTMKKAILARAFRGELGTNNPAEEWAGELVKKVL